MKKNYFLVLVLGAVFLSACSSSESEVVGPSQLAENDGVVNVEVSPETEERVGLNSVIHEDKNFNFKITMPLSWSGYIVQSRKVNKEFYGTTYSVNELDFGFPVRLDYDEDSNNISAVDCDSCFARVFSLTVYNSSDFDKINIKNKAEIAKNGTTPLNDLGLLVGNNSDYVFLAPRYIHGQSYDGQFIYDRQTEAAAFFSYFEAPIPEQVIIKEPAESIDLKRVQERTSDICFNYLYDSETTPEESTCANESKILTRDTCYTRIAFDTKIIDYCDKISDFFQRRATCMINVANSNKVDNYCEVIKNEYPDIYKDCELQFKGDVDAYSKDRLNIQSIKTIRAALDEYFSKYKEYPQNLSALVEKCILFEIPVSSPSDNEICKDKYDYKYSLINSQNYTLTYCLDGSSDLGPGYVIGTNIASSKKIN